jgi:hypothetical protein
MAPEKAKGICSMKQIPLPLKKQPAPMLFASRCTSCGAPGVRLPGGYQDRRMGHRNGEYPATRLDLAQEMLIPNGFERHLGFGNRGVFEVGGANDGASVIFNARDHQVFDSAVAEAIDSVGSSRKRFARDGKLERYFHDDLI